MVVFSETSAEAITIKKPKNLELTLECGMSTDFFEDYWSVIYRKIGVAKVYSMVIFGKTLTETITIKNLKLT